MFPSLLEMLEKKQLSFSDQQDVGGRRRCSSKKKNWILSVHRKCTLLVMMMLMADRICSQDHYCHVVNNFSLQLVSHTPTHIRMRTYTE